MAVADLIKKFEKISVDDVKQERAEQGQHEETDKPYVSSGIDSVSRGASSQTPINNTIDTQSDAPGELNGEVKDKDEDKLLGKENAEESEVEASVQNPIDDFEESNKEERSEETSKVEETEEGKQAKNVAQAGELEDETELSLSSPTVGSAEAESASDNVEDLQVVEENWLRQD